MRASAPSAGRVAFARIVRATGSTDAMPAPTTTARTRGVAETRDAALRPRTGSACARTRSPTIAARCRSSVAHRVAAIAATASASRRPSTTARRASVAAHKDAARCKPAGAPLAIRTAPPRRGASWKGSVRRCVSPSTSCSAWGRAALSPSTARARTASRASATAAACRDRSNTARRDARSSTADDPRATRRPLHVPNGFWGLARLCA